MTEEERVNFEKCDRWRGCSASVCPLYNAVESTYYISGDKRCTKILDYLEGNELPEELKTAIAQTEPKWTKALGDALLNKWLNNRKDARSYFKKAI